ncbi:MAG: hypothetical protein IPK52_20820 [Chloroflexi bacterium]|nr:hypothetical protein [Chloroflexota bacterium]
METRECRCRQRVWGGSYRKCNPVFGMFTGNLDVIVDTLIAALFAWLGLYLIRRDLRDRALVLAGTGGLSYAAAIAADALGMAEAVGPGLALAAAGLWFGAVAAHTEAIGEAWRSAGHGRSG